MFGKLLLTLIILSCVGTVVGEEPLPDRMLVDFDNENFNADQIYSELAEGMRLGGHRFL